MGDKFIFPLKLSTLHFVSPSLLARALSGKNEARFPFVGFITPFTPYNHVDHLIALPPHAVRWVGG